MSARTLETTPEMCAQALAALTPMEQGMCMESWLARDAANAHDLLDIVRRLHAGILDPNIDASDARDAAAPWLEA